MADSPWWLLRELMRPHRRALAAYGLVLSIATALPLAGSLLLARFVTLAVDGAPARRLVPLALGYAGCGLLTSFVTVAVTWRATTLAWRITDGLRHELADRVLRADLAFHRDRTPGELVTRVDADVTAMTQFLSQVVARVIAIVLLGVASVVVAAVVEPVLAPVLTAGLLLIGAVTWAQRNSANAATAAERAAEADVMGVAEEYLGAAEEVAALGGGSHGVHRVAVGSDRLVRAVGRRVRVQMWAQGSIRTAIIAAEVLVIACGALFAGAGWASIGTVFLGYRFVAVVRQPVESLTWRLQEAQGAAGAARRVLDLLEETRRLPDGDERLPPGPLDICFEGVELVYDDDPEPGAPAPEVAAGIGTADRGRGTPAVARLDLHLPAGRVTGLVGRSGSGKTSLARLVLRLVPPTAGRVLVGGVDLQRVADADLRRRMAAVPQDVQLFPGTVHDNVALFADPDPVPAGAAVPAGGGAEAAGAHDRARTAGVTVALDAAGLGSWARALPDGLDSLIDPDGRGDSSGAGLSAGEAQLLALARALRREPDIVVLDEATSRVDPVTEAEIRRATARLVRGRTAIVIAHRLETLEICDDIAVMADGRLVEIGPRSELAADPDSHYARLLATSAAAELQ